jgi:hypothetical protein
VDCLAARIILHRDYLLLSEEDKKTHRRFIPVLRKSSYKDSLASENVTQMNDNFHGIANANPVNYSDVQRPKDKKNTEEKDMEEREAISMLGLSNQ